MGSCFEGKNPFFSPIRFDPVEKKVYSVLRLAIDLVSLPPLFSFSKTSLPSEGVGPKGNEVKKKEKKVFVMETKFRLRTSVVYL